MTCDSHTNLIPELQFFMIPIPIPIPLELIPILIPIPASYDSDSNSDSNKPGFDSDSDSGIWFRIRNHLQLWFAKHPWKHLKFEEYVDTSDTLSIICLTHIGTAIIATIIVKQS